MRVERALCALILVGLVGGCTSDGDKPASQDPSAAAPGAAAPGGSAPAWTEPANYSFALSRGCEEAAPVGRYQATVANGKIVKSGGKELALELEEKGYDWVRKHLTTAALEGPAR